MKKCDHCKLPKEEEEFNWRYKSLGLGIRHPTCGECQNGFRKNWYEAKPKKDTYRMSKPENMRSEILQEIMSLPICLHTLVLNMVKVILGY